MTREEAFHVIDTYCVPTAYPHTEQWGTLQKIKEALEALKQEPSRDMEEIREVMSCDADAETKCKMISEIVNGKPHYFKEQEPCNDAINRQAVDELSKNLVHTTRDKADFLCNFWEGLQKLPPVKPQEPILDKIRAEIAEYKDDKIIHTERNEMIDIVLEIIDKYKVEGRK